MDQRAVQAPKLLRTANGLAALARDVCCNVGGVICVAMLDLLRVVFAPAIALSGDNVFLANSNF